MTINNFQCNGYVIFSTKIFLYTIYSIGLISFYFSRFEQFSINIFPLHCYICLVFHAIIIIIMFLFPNLRELIYTYSSVNNVMFSQVAAYRIAGFSGGGSALLSFFQATGILLSIYLIEKRTLSFFWSVIGNILLFISLVLTGRTGILFSCLIILFFAPRLFLKKTFLVNFIFSIFFFILLATIILKYLSANPNFLTAIERFLADFGIGTYSLQSRNTFEVLKEHIFFPDQLLSLKTFLFGTSSNGREQLMWLYSDIGYIKDLFMGGIVGCITLYTIFSLILYYTLKYGRTVLSKYIVFFGILLFIFNFKESALAGRHILFLFLALFHLDHQVSHLRINEHLV